MQRQQTRSIMNGKLPVNLTYMFFDRPHVDIKRGRNLFIALERQH